MKAFFLMEQVKETVKKSKVRKVYTGRFFLFFYSIILIYISQTNIYINTLKKEKKKKSYNYNTTKE